MKILEEKRELLGVITGRGWAVGLRRNSLMLEIVTLPTCQERGLTGRTPAEGVHLQKKVGSQGEECKTQSTHPAHSLFA